MITGWTFAETCYGRFTNECNTQSENECNTQLQICVTPNLNLDVTVVSKAGVTPNLKIEVTVVSKIGVTPESKVHVTVVCKVSLGVTPDLQNLVLRLMLSYRCNTQSMNRCNTRNKLVSHQNKLVSHYTNKTSVTLIRRLGVTPGSNRV